MAGFNISSFFGGSSSGGGLFDSFNFSDYASIRSGAYKKLMTKYYGVTGNKTASKQSDKTPVKDRTQKSVISTDTTGLTKMKKEAGELKTSAENLSKGDLWKKKDGSYDMDKIADAVKAFANDYNDVIEQSGKVGTKAVTQQVGYMESLSNTMSKALSKVGVSFGSDGKMTVDTDALKKADVDDVKSLFSGNYSYASQVALKASGINSAALRNTSMYSSEGTYSSFSQSMFNYWA